MQYHKKYEIEPKYVKDGSVDWHTTGSGAFILCTYRGNRYFVKRFTFGPRYPSKSLPAPVYAQYMAEASRLEDKQKEINTRFKKKGYTFEKDHIVIEDDNFWDDDTNMFVTVTRFVPNGLPDDNDFSTLRQADFMALCLDMAELIRKAHAAGVTHGDLKEKNFFFSQQGGKIVPYLIDFDLSYPSDYGVRTRSDGSSFFPDGAPFSAGYESPELYFYNSQKEDDPDSGDPKTITDKTDIFTLGVVFHKMWTRQFPMSGGSAGSFGQAVYEDSPVVIDPKFNFEIGSANGNKFSSLLQWMFLKDSTKRPTADQVLDVLRDKLDVSDFIEVPGAPQKFEVEPHAVHKNSITLLDKDSLKAKGVKVFQKVMRGGQYLYQVKLKDGTELVLDVDQLVEKGYATAKNSALEELWEADAEMYEYVSADEIAKLGIASIARRSVMYRKFYCVTYRTGRTRTGGASDLLRDGIVKKKVVAVTSAATSDSPWPEDGMRYDAEAMGRRNVTKVERVMAGADHKYRITMTGADGTIERVVDAKFMKLMGYIK